MLTQYEVRELNTDRQMVVWLDHNRLKIGSRVTLKGADGLWAVCQVYGTHDRGDIKRGWHNNI